MNNCKYTLQVGTRERENLADLIKIRQFNIFEIII